ncbi:MAG: HAD hydrolase family protein [Bacteroidetes bacterium]|jgi:3-deoxy-D-manno-octulosonate 8-phosphate phosphatase (KDO 8-P phosphatase)|nr:HAD hydrolase family protein [Bacteroidota bacterium]
MNFKEKLKDIKAFAFDVDGVFSNGSIMLHPEGEMVRMMNIKDGYAVQYCVKLGFPVAIISGGKSEAVRARFKGLGVTDIYLGASDKTECFEDYYFKYELQPDDILYMGDDIPDYEVMTKTGLPACPADAAEEIKQISHYISDRKGGEGCVRDVIEQVLKVQNKWMLDTAFSW